MQRRLALSLALAFTTVVIFALVIVGRTSGLFGSNSEPEQAPVATSPEEDMQAALRYLAAISPASPSAPEVVTEYVYVDEPAQPPIVTYVTRGAQPAAPTGPAPAPTGSAPANAPQEPTAAPSATRVPPTAAPPSPTPQAPQPVPTQPAPSEPRRETEFEGTVTAVDGESATFTHGGTTTVVRVPASVGHVSIGDTVVVHALLLSSGWVAKEIERED